MQLEPARRQPAAGAAAAHGRPRWRSTFPAAVAPVAPESSGEEVGEGEEVAAELTVGSIWAEKGREREFDGEGRSSAERQWRTAVCGLDSADGGLNRARGWSEEVRGEVARLGVRRIEAGQRGLAAATSGGIQLELCAMRA